MRTRVGVLLIDDQKVLLIHRWKNGREYYVVPGGGVEESESIEDAARREVLEETSLRVELDAKFFEIIFSDVKQNNIFFLSRNFRGDSPRLAADSPEIDRLSEINRYELEWVPLEQVKGVKLLPSQLKAEIVTKLV